ncbi:hypothetical protein AB833_29505 [Chromatiales bacterium (ex Bugula neritina AB1)]|nr:hypothetical protein AB833_29505 [Chromatiales bacterium (ex Bugula neritina AB1)]
MNKPNRSVYSNRWEITTVFIGLGVLALLLWGVWALVEIRNNEWQAFKEANNCRIVARVKGDVDVGIGTSINSNGDINPVFTTDVSPDMTGWLCDDGVTYWR